MKKKLLLTALLLCLSVLTVINASAILPGNYCNVYAPDGRVVSIQKTNLPLYQSMGWYTSPVCYIMSYDGRTAVIEKDLLASYLNVGWIEGAQIYTPDGRTAIIKKSELDLYLAVGWYKVPMCYIIAGGRTAAIPQSELYTYMSLGWNEACMIYAPNGRTAVIAKSDLSAYINVGWSAKPYGDKQSNTDANTNNTTSTTAAPNTTTESESLKEDAASMPSEEYRLTVSGNTYYIGMPSADLGTPDEIIPSVYGVEWYVFGTSDYKNFFAAGVKDGKVEALISSGTGFDYCGYKAGESFTENNSITRNLATDYNDSELIHAVFISDQISYRRSSVTADQLAGESKLNFHLTNGFRVYHGLNAFKWSDKAAASARLHSEDMANQNYFSHTGLDGSSSADRMRKQGIGNRMWAENIYAGLYTGFSTYAGWINSAGHRSNMLNSCDYLGVGAAYNGNSSYGCYFTQNFYK